MPAEVPHFYLGLATTGHDPALAIVSEEGEVLFAEATERSAQLKIGWGIPCDLPALIAPALDRYCPNVSRFTIATSWLPLGPNGAIGVDTPFVRKEEQTWLVGLNAAARTEAGRGISELRGAQSIVARYDFDHHLCHAANALHCAPFDEGLCAVMDGEGDVGAISLFDVHDRRFKRRWRSWGPASLGAIYGWLTNLCGFDWTAGEQWKVMGLAGFAEPPAELVAELKKLINLGKSRPMLVEGAELERIVELVAARARKPGQPLETAAPLAAAAQAAFAHWADAILTREQDRRAHNNLMLSGGCALNSSYNGTVRGRMGFEQVHVPSAPGDDGNAIGAALLAWQKDHPDQRLPRGSEGAYLGSVARMDSVAKVRRSNAFQSRQVEDRAQATADLLAAGKIVGTMQGRAEFGPRALGHRSILADPRDPGMKDRINKAVKGREAYRPFAPVVEAGRIDEFFSRSQPAPYMSFTLPWRADAAKRFPAVVHEDSTGRVQTVEPGQFLFDVLKAMPEGGDVLLNTSLNVMGKPIVHSVEDAVTVLATTGLDALIIEDVIFEKALA